MKLTCQRSQAHTALAFDRLARVGLCLATIFSWPLLHSALGQSFLPIDTDEMEDTEDSPADGVDDIHTRSIFDHRNYMLRTDAGDGVGYLRGFQTFAAFQPITVSEDELVLWMSPRGYVTFNSGTFGGNLGAGARWLDWEQHRIYGGGAWFDHDNNGSNQYDQFGASFESLGQFLDFRANGYFPSNQNPHLISQSLNPNFLTFVGHNIGIGQTLVFNSALRGGDFEVGGAMPGIFNGALRTYGGGYYYQGPQSGGGVYGVRGRLELLYTQNVWANVSVTHDRLFGTNIISGATIYFGSGLVNREFFAPMPLAARLYQQMERQYRVAVQRSIQNDIVLALRAGGTGGSGGAIGTPIFVDHVNNNAAAGGDGTVEHPFNHLPTSTPTNVDIVFVNRGDGTSKFMDQGITLNDFQRLLGDGVQHQFTALQGTFALPGFHPGALPTMTNLAGSGITLANHNEVSGFNVLAASTHGIYGTSITDFNINHVNVTTSGSGGLVLTNAAGTGRIADSTFNSNIGDGVQISNTTGGTLGLTMSGDAADNNTADGIAVLLSGGSTFTANLTGVEANNNNNPFAGAGVGNGFALTASDATATVVMSQDTFNSNGLNGLNFVLSSGATLTGAFDQITANGNNNPLVAAGAGNGFGYSSDASTGDVAITRSTFGTNGTNGINFATSNGSMLTAQLINNNTTINGNTGIDGNLQDGIGFQNTDSTVVATLLNNLITNNGGMGVNIVSTSTNAAASFNLTAGGYLTQDTNGNGVLDPGEGHVVIPSLNFPSQNPEVIVGNGLLDREGNTITGNHGAGISFHLVDNSGGTFLSSGQASIIGNIIQSTGALTPASPTYVGQGIDIRLDGSSATSNPELMATVIDANTIGSLRDATLGNAGSGIVVATSQASIIDSLQIGNGSTGLPHTGNQIGHNGGDGITIINSTNTNALPMGPVTIENNRIDNNSGDGATTGNGIAIFAMGTNALPSAYSVTNNDISGNVLNGVFLANNSTALATQTVGLTVTANTFTSNGQMGVQVQDTNGINNLTVGDPVIVALGNTFLANHGAGIGYFTIGTPNSATAPVVSIFNNVITQTAPGTLPVAPGYGIDINLSSDAALPRNVDVQIGNNTITSNASDGVHVEVHNLVSLPTMLTISANTITGNGGNGVYFVADGGAALGFTSVSVAENPYDSGMYAAPASTLVQDASGLVTLSWIDTRVANTVLFEATDNVISGNAASGMSLNIGTGSLVNAMVQRNTFSLNGQKDFVTTAFVAGPVTPADIITTPRGLFPEERTIFLDKIAQLDLRFISNSDISLSGSISTVSGGNLLYQPGVNDSVKNGTSATTSSPTDSFFPRPASLFQVEDKYTVTNTQPGITTSALNDTNFFSADGPAATQGIFTGAGYYLEDLGAFSTGTPNPPFTTPLLPPYVFP